jgi:hypothetical protein
VAIIGNRNPTKPLEGSAEQKCQTLYAKSKSLHDQLSPRRAKKVLKPMAIANRVKAELER